MRVGVGAKVRVKTQKALDVKVRVVLLLVGATRVSSVSLSLPIGGELQQLYSPTISPKITIILLFFFPNRLANPLSIELLEL